RVDDVTLNLDIFHERRDCGDSRRLIGTHVALPPEDPPETAASSGEAVLLRPLASGPRPVRNTDLRDSVACSGKLLSSMVRTVASIGYSKRLSSTCIFSITA